MNLRLLLYLLLFGNYSIQPWGGGGGVIDGNLTVTRYDKFSVTDVLLSRITVSGALSQLCIVKKRISPVFTTKRINVIETL
jgi:hypothetical protein